MSNLRELPNIGEELEKLLNEAEIYSEEELKSLGAEKTFMRLNISGRDACINKLFAIEGAIQGMRWHNLEVNRKEELKIFLNQLKKLDKKNENCYHFLNNIQL